MNEYINRNDTLNCFHEWVDKHGDVHCADEMEEYRAVESLPSIEVIRCKNCKYHDPEDKKCDCGHDIYWQLPRPDEWFCADGESR